MCSVASAMTLEISGLEHSFSLVFRSIYLYIYIYLSLSLFHFLIDTVLIRDANGCRSVRVLLVRPTLLNVPALIHIGLPPSPFSLCSSSPSLSLHFISFFLSFSLSHYSSYFFIHLFIHSFIHSSASTVGRRRIDPARVRLWRPSKSGADRTLAQTIPLLN